MACILYSSTTQLELYVIAWSTSLTSSMSPVIAQRHTWFQSWNPAHDSMQLTIRQGPQSAQKAASSLLQQWMRTNEVLTLSWPERNMSYKCTVASAPYVERYDTPVTDLTVQLFLVTNLIMSQTAAVSISDNVTGMLGTNLVTGTIQDELDRLTAEEKAALADQAKRHNTQWAGYKVQYNNDGTATVTVYTAQHGILGNIIGGNDGNMITTNVKRQYVVSLTGEFVQAMNTGSDSVIQFYLRTNAISQTTVKD